MQTQFFSDAADVFTVKAAGDYSLTFLGGDDTLTVAGGTTTLAAMGEGDDYVRLNSGSATVYGESGADRFDIWASGVAAHGGADNDLFTLRGGTGQVITGDDGDDRVNFYADATAVTVDLGAGNDLFMGYDFAVTGTIRGGAGNDSFYEFNGSGGLDIYGGTGDDVYRADGAHFPNFIERPGEGIDAVQLARGLDYVLPDNIEKITVGTYSGSSARAATITGNAIDNTINGAANAETIYGLGGDDHLYGKDGNDVLWGGDGNDTLDGGNGNDTLWGVAGNDVLNGHWGDDVMAGGTGDDSYYVDSVNDVVIENAGEGTDTIRTTVDLTLPDNVENALLQGTIGRSLYGNGLDNHLSGTVGDDYIMGGDGNDVVKGGDGNDYLGGDGGDDSIIAGSGNDYIYGDDGNDNISAGDGDDYVQGGTGSERLDGGNGNDFLAGGSGADTLTGGAGGDTFYFYDVSDSMPSASDRITDFSTAAAGGSPDQLDLSGVDADVAVNGDQAFAALAGGPAAHSLWLTVASTNTVGSMDFTLYGDVNGDTVADFAVVVHSTAGFSAADILF